MSTELVAYLSRGRLAMGGITDENGEPYTMVMISAVAIGARPVPVCRDHGTE